MLAKLVIVSRRTAERVEISPSAIFPQCHLCGIFPLSSSLPRWRLCGVNGILKTVEIIQYGEIMTQLHR